MLCCLIYCLHIRKTLNEIVVHLNCSQQRVEFKPKSATFENRSNIFELINCRDNLTTGNYWTDAPVKQLEEELDVLNHNLSLNLRNMKSKPRKSVLDLKTHSSYENLSSTIGDDLKVFLP